MKGIFVAIVVMGALLAASVWVSVSVWTSMDGGEIAFSMSWHGWLALFLGVVFTTALESPTAMTPSTSETISTEMRAAPRSSSTARSRVRSRFGRVTSIGHRFRRRGRRRRPTPRARSCCARSAAAAPT